MNLMLGILSILVLNIKNNDLLFNGILNFLEKYTSSEEPPVLGICINNIFILLFIIIIYYYYLR